MTDLLMCRIDGDLAPALRRSLDHLAQELYWGTEDHYHESVEQVRETAENDGFEFAGRSENRLVMKIPEDQLPDRDEPMVVKLPRRRQGYAGGIKQNVEEIDIYRNAPDWLLEYITPIEAAHEDGYWLMMPYAPEPDSEEIEERKWELRKEGIVTNEIMVSQNWGRWNGDVYVTDYGLYVSDFVTDVDVRDWSKIVDEGDRQRGNIPDEDHEDRESEQEAMPDNPPARRVVMSANVLPGLKGEIRQKLKERTNLVVKTETNKILELDNGKEVKLKIEHTEPRSDRHSRDRKFQIQDDTVLSFE